jgi:hypothetical protein
MNAQIATASLTMTMTSIELLEVVNQARALHGEGEIRRNDFTTRCLDELDGEYYETFVVRNPNGTASEAIRMTRDQCMYVLMRESKAVRRTAAEQLNKPTAPTAPTTASMFFQSAQVMLEMESRTAALEKRQINMQARLDEVVENNVMKVCPQNAESITYIRKRIGKMFGLSTSVIDEAMRQLPYSPKPAGMVLNDNEAAKGSHYAVFWVKDVTTVFKRFVAECQRETTAFVSHPFIDSRFKLAAGKECE